MREKRRRPKSNYGVPQNVLCDLDTSPESNLVSLGLWYPGWQGQRSGRAWRATKELILAPPIHILLLVSISLQSMFLLWSTQFFLLKNLAGMNDSTPYEAVVLKGRCTSESSGILFYMVIPGTASYPTVKLWFTRVRLGSRGLYFCKGLRWSMYHILWIWP